MRFYKRVVIAEYERGLLFRNKSLESVLEPGVYKFFDFKNAIKIDVFDLNKAAFNHVCEEVLLKRHPRWCEQYFQVVNLSIQQVGLVYNDGILMDVLPPSTRQFYWKGLLDIHVDIVAIASDYRIDAVTLAVLNKVRDVALQRKLASFLSITEVSDDAVALLAIDGQLHSTLQPGLYGFWQFNRAVRIELVDCRLQMMDVSGQEILSRDKVSLRINVTAAYQISDPVKTRHAFKDAADYLYRELQFGLRQAVAIRTLDYLLTEKGATEAEIFRYVEAKVSEQGIALKTVGIKDVILPGDMKEILNQVVEAEKVSQANVIKRREETAATRSLLNTAKLMDDNPTLLRLKELEVLEKVTEKVDRLTVFGGLDGVLNDTVKINV